MFRLRGLLSTATPERRLQLAAAGAVRDKSAGFKLPNRGFSTHSRTRFRV